jgi:hypothetical protein
MKKMKKEMNRRGAMFNKKNLVSLCPDGNRHDGGIYA